MDNVFFIIIFIILVIIVGVLANYQIAHDRERIEGRRRETEKFRSVFTEDLGKFRGKIVKGENDDEEETRPDEPGNKDEA